MTQQTARILVINPGSTSTKLAVYADREAQWSHTVGHPVEQLAAFSRIIDQYEFRKQLVLEALEEAGIPFAFDAIVGRGGLLHPIPGGVYEVNDAMLHDIIHAKRTHPCNLGCLIAHELAVMLPGCRAFIADPGVVDELDDIARISGMPDLPHLAFWHALNQRAIGRRFAADLTAQHPDRPVRYADLNLIICHMGGGISVGTHRLGRAVDVPNALDGDGPFAPERAGNVDAGQLIELCYAHPDGKEEIKRRICGKGGLVAHLGTTDIPAIERRIAEGDQHAELVLNAMIYRIAKEIGAAAVVLYGQIDAILLTGGMARSAYITSRLTERVSFLAPVHIYPGEDEMEALAHNAWAALRGLVEVKVYQ